jgi:hypothetical protein
MYKDIEKVIYIGDGFYELETHELCPYRWASNEFDLFINDDTVKTITLNIDFLDGLDIVEIIGAELTLKTTDQIELSILDKIVKIKCEYLIPKLQHGTSDTRKLSFKLYSIKINELTLPIKNVLYIPSKCFNHSLNDNLLIKYGEYGEIFIESNKNNKLGKINLNNNQISFYSHRSGWDYVIKSLFDLNNNDGVHFDGFLENTFVWRKNELLENKQIPYKKSWIGFFHNPPNMPAWFSNNGGHANSILCDNVFRESLKYCKGIYVLSNYHANFLKLFIPEIPINVLYHPTEIPKNIFTYNKFINNSNKCIVNIGWWLRKLNSFFLLKSPYKKIQLLPIDKCKSVVTGLRDIEKTIYDIKITDEEYNSVEFVDQLTNDAYDELLSKNIVYLNLYDSSVNNVIIECIARGTPLLVNKLPAIIEYLGEDYPFYFSDEREANKKLNDLNLINQTHEYLVTFENRKRILIGNFMEDFKNSTIYKNL